MIKEKGNLKDVYELNFERIGNKNDLLIYDKNNKKQVVQKNSNGNQNETTKYFYSIFVCNQIIFGLIFTDLIIKIKYVEVSLT